MYYAYVYLLHHAFVFVIIEAPGIEVMDKELPAKTEEVITPSDHKVSRKQHEKYTIEDGRKILEGVLKHRDEKVKLHGNRFWIENKVTTEVGKQLHFRLYLHTCICV